MTELNWTWRPDWRCYHAETDEGDFYIYPILVNDRFELDAAGGHVGDFETLDEAKAAAGRRLAEERS